MVTPCGIVAPCTSVGPKPAFHLLFDRTSKGRREIKSPRTRNGYEMPCKRVQHPPCHISANGAGGHLWCCLVQRYYLELAWRVTVKARKKKILVLPVSRRIYRNGFVKVRIGSVYNVFNQPILILSVSPRRKITIRKFAKIDLAVFSGQVWPAMYN